MSPAYFLKKFIESCSEQQWKDGMREVAIRFLTYEEYRRPKIAEKIARYIDNADSKFASKLDENDFPSNAAETKQLLSDFE